MAIAFKSRKQAATEYIDRALIEEQERLQKAAEPVAAMPQALNPLLPPEPLVSEHDAAWIKRSQASKGWRAAKKGWQEMQGLPEAEAIRAENQRKWAEQRASKAERNRLESERRKLTLQQRLEAKEARRELRVRVSLWINQEVLAWFKAGGKGWSIKMAKMLEQEARRRMDHETAEEGPETQGGR